MLVNVRKRMFTCPDILLNDVHKMETVRTTTDDGIAVISLKTIGDLNSVNRREKMETIGILRKMINDRE